MMSRRIIIYRFSVVVLVSLFFAWLVAITTVDAWDWKHLPRYPKPALGYVHRMAVHHGFVVYGKNWQRDFYRWLNAIQPIVTLPLMILGGWFVWRLMRARRRMKDSQIPETTPVQVSVDKVGLKYALEVMRAVWRRQPEDIETPMEADQCFRLLASVVSTYSDPITVWLHTPEAGKLFYGDVNAERRRIRIYSTVGRPEDHGVVPIRIQPVASGSCVRVGGRVGILPWWGMLGRMFAFLIVSWMATLVAIDYSWFALVLPLVFVLMGGLYSKIGSTRLWMSALVTVRYTLKRGSSGAFGSV